MTIALEKLSKRFGSFTAVHALSLEVPAGQIIGFLGPNGSGKTTTVRMLCGLLKPDQGDAYVHGHSVTHARNQVKTHLGVLPDAAALFPHLSLLEHLVMEARVRGLSNQEARLRAEDLLRYTDLWEKRHVFAGHGSVGMCKKLGIALALIHLPPVVILDEPFEGLDPVSVRKIGSLLKRIVKLRGTTLFLTSHLLALIEDLVDRVAIIAGGELIKDLNVAELKARGEAVLDVYLDAFDARQAEEVCFSWLN